MAVGSLCSYPWVPRANALVGARLALNIAEERVFVKFAAILMLLSVVFLSNSGRIGNYWKLLATNVYLWQ